ncbi:hypothetical protein PTSG_02835 [Salpingoeca rosetta]|uniref:Uncharacterized protein n=1 Tax=Salpingoeca rosetta (strain ATCC 50818 / BSB-021) TaxID=946362 RepID=F2U3G8_SALR5|nr:uncharacterized protein PTSG_02835 [Salpingoeca rosetta]EGD82162.1 hypothetical protein PTSG_02835 [Salpingoeca rosetta]|eukprot:XP_004996345.1 hypothetical protein PTSG_02835 [Salpingoeca rosetta]
MCDVQCGPAARWWMEEQKNNVNLLLLLHVATWLHDDDHHNNSHGVSSGKVHRGMWIVCSEHCGHRMRQQQCVRPTVIKTTLMIEDETVAVEHLAEMSSGELADIVRQGGHSVEIVSLPQQREEQQEGMSCTSCVPNIEGVCASVHSNVLCGPARWHRAGEALQPSSPASARNANTSTRHDGRARCVQMVHVDDASRRVEIKHETYATWSHVCVCVALKDAGVRGGAGTRITTHRSEIRFCPITFISTMHGAANMNVTLTGGGDLFFETGILPLHLCFARAIHRTPRHREHLQPAEGRYSQGNRVEERIDTDWCSAATT